MGKKEKKGCSDDTNKMEKIEREGENLLGKPKFKKLENNRYKCVETGHEVPNEAAKALYSKTKHCRIGLIDAAVSKNKPPLNIFRQDPDCREGENLLGKPNFKKLENIRYRCVETGHEVPNEADKVVYAKTKHWRIGLIDAAVAKNKPPLNIFRQDPACRLKLVCQLTGDIINKSEEHIWKHINGKRFLNMLEKKEAEKETDFEIVEGDKPKEDHVKEKKKKKEKKKNKKKNKKGEGEEKKKEEDSDIGKDNSETLNSSDKECDSENGEFWEPPAGERWDMDDGGERWSVVSDSDSDGEFEHDDVAIEADEAVDDESKEEARELSIRTKRMAIEIEPSSLASRKKKKKKNEAPE